MRERANKAVAALVCALCLLCALLAGCSFGGDASRFQGTWDLRYGDTANNDAQYTRENVDSMRALGLEAYLNLDQDGSLALISFDGVKYGNWKTVSATEAEGEIEGVKAVITLDGEELKLVQGPTTFVFSKGVPKESSSAASKDDESDESESAQSSVGLSDLIVRGSLIDQPVAQVSDQVCTIVVNGVGTDKLGDPGFNVQITNNYHKSIDVWIDEPFMVDGTPVRAYLFETIGAGRSATAFIQFDVADMKSSSPSALVNVSGVILVDDDANTTIAEYPFKM